MRELPVLVVVESSFDTVVVPTLFIATTSKYSGAELVASEPPGLVELAAAKFVGVASGMFTLHVGNTGIICVLFVPPCLNGLGVVNDVAAAAWKVERKKNNVRAMAAATNTIAQIDLLLGVAIIVCFKHLIRLVDLEIDGLPAALAKDGAG